MQYSSEDGYGSLVVRHIESKTTIYNTFKINILYIKCEYSIQCYSVNADKYSASKCLGITE